MSRFVIVRVDQASSWTSGALQCLAGRLGENGYISPDPIQVHGGFQRYEVYVGEPIPADPAGVVRTLLDQCDHDWPQTIVVG